ncbi:MAG: hypothetical protein IPK58_09765 [Acidobacteria bacterium]|nr:hypothetical protein [Acidobacteriota bacterium]
MKQLVFFLILIAPVAAFAQSKTVTAQNGQSYKIASTDTFRGNEELCLYTVGYYAKKPTSEAGVDVYIVENKIVEIRDRAGFVFLQNKPDPGPIAVGKDGFVLSGHGAARRWVLANLKVGEAVSLDGKPPVSLASPYAYAGYGMIQTVDNKTYYFDGKNSPRSQNLVIYYSPDVYQKTPPNDSGIDILVVGGRVADVRDRAGAVYLEKKADPGPVMIVDPANSYVISGNGDGRNWLLANIKAGDEIRVSGVDLTKEVKPFPAVPCFPGAFYRKAVSSYDSWTGIGGLVKLGTPKTDETRVGSNGQPLDNFSVYMGGNAGGKFEVDAGLTWEFTVDETGKKSDKRNAFRPFWRTKTWNAAPAKKEFYFYPGETVQMAVLVAGVGKLRLIITDGKTKVFQQDFDAEGFVAGAPRQFKRVNAIDQVGNEGKPAQATKAEFTGSEWLQTILIRGEGAAAQQVILSPERFTDMRCGAGNVVLGPFDRAKGAEKIDIFGITR